MTLPVLYKQTKTSAVQQYSVSVVDSTIYVTQGQVNGKQQTYETLITTGKNLGKSNATTPQQQAESEAQSKWQAKLDKGYSTDPSGVITVKLPMKVQTYQDCKANIKFPCYAMPKYNGVNCLTDVLALSSRGGLPYPSLDHITADLLELQSILGTTTLNGELYIPGQHLQDITAAVKKPNALTPLLELRIFGLPELDLSFEETCKLLNDAPSSRYVKPVRSAVINSHKELDEMLERAISLKLEGLVIYNADGKYEYNVRSSDVFKYKLATDAEFKIVNYTIDKSGHPVFTCETATGQSFKVKPKGTSETRKQIIADFDSLYLNNYYTVEYETLSAAGIPLKPVGIALRACSAVGEPIE